MFLYIFLEDASLIKYFYLCIFILCKYLPHASAHRQKRVLDPLELEL